jgi:TolA-binding protein
MKRANLTRVVCALGLMVSQPRTADAQLEENYREQAVEAVGDERDEEERESVRENLEAEPRATQSWFEESIGIDEVERLHTAMNRLRNLISGATRNCDQWAVYTFRLAELYSRIARFHEQRAFERRDQAYELRETNPARERTYLRAADDDIEQSDQYATDAVDLYADLYDECQAVYPDMDAVLYYLGSTLSQLEMNEDALDFFGELVNDYPSSSYMPRALLAFGEFYFLQGDMATAQGFYEAVAQFPETSIYPYALYQEAWCYYNIEEYPQGMQRLLDAIEASSGESAGRIRMRTRAIHDLALFYVETAPAGHAFRFFEEVAPDDAFELVSLVAQLYSDDGNFEEANALYRELMSRNRESFEIVNYQSEIVRNTLPGQDQEDIVREVRRWVELFEVAREFEDATPEIVAEAQDRIEYQLRRLATTYHREAQVLNNPLMYALAYNLYEDYDTHFARDADPDTSYLMTYYYAELLYRHERYEDAAAKFELCLELNPDGQYAEEATYKAVLSYTRLVDLEASPPEIGEAELPEDGACVPPTPLEIPEVLQRLIAAADRYLALDPPDEYAVEVEFVACRVRYDYNHLEEAFACFSHIGTAFQTVDAERADISQELALDTLNGLCDIDGMWDFISNQGGADHDPLLRQIEFGRCRELMVANNHQAAGLCFFEYFQTWADCDTGDQALYNAALSFDSANQISRGVRVREVLIQYCSESDLVPEVRFTLGQSFHRLALYRDAAEHYENFARDYPEEENAKQALGNACIFQQGLGEWDAAIADYELFIELFHRDDPEAAAQAFFQIAEIHYERGELPEAIGQFEEYIDNHADDGPPGLAVQSATRIGRMQYTTGPENAEAWFMLALEFYNDLSDIQRAELSGKDVDAAAEARFMQGEGIFLQFEVMELDGDEEAVQLGILEMVEIGRLASAVYADVQQLQRPGWSIAAFTRLGRFYHLFYERIISAPIPDGLPFEVEEQYRSMLTEQSLTIREQAIVNYQTALAIAQRAGWFNEYSEEAEQLLAQLDPSFRAGNEIRAEPGYELHESFSNEFIDSLAEEQEVEEVEEAEEAPPREPAPDPEPETGDVSEVTQ